MLGCTFIFSYIHLFCEKDIILKEHMFKMNLVGIEIEQWVK